MSPPSKPSGIKSIVIKGLRPTYTEEKVNELCREYGEIESIFLSKS